MADISNDQGQLLQNPELDSSLKPTRRAVKDIKQAENVITATIEANRELLVINSRIAAKLNAEKPHTQSALEAEGLGWKSNFTTKPLPQAAEKATPRFTEAVNGLKYFTNSALPPEIPGASKKTEIFRSEITKTIRKRRGWNDLMTDIASEDAIFGHTIVAWLDEFTWMPKHFRQDEFFLPVGTKQNAEQAQLIVFKQNYLPHELFEEIEDRERAATLGWNIENAVTLINTATPVTWTAKNVTDTARLYEDMKRELNTCMSYEAGAQVIETYSLLVREVTGKISHYRLGKTGSGNMLELYSKDDRFDSMSDVSSFFTYQKGNGTMRGSKGIGRELYELAGIIDRCRNEIVDRLNLSGKALIQTDDKNLKRFRMSVVGNAILISRAFTVLEQKIDGDVEPFLALDNYLGFISDQLIGSVSPRQLQGERVTKAQVDLFAAREEEAKDSKISRFLEQFVIMMGTIQKRLLDPKTLEDDAKALQKLLLDKGLTREELDMLRNESVAGTVEDLTPTERQQVVLIATENAGNPLYNQRALQEEKILAQVGAEFADKILLPDEDPTVTAEQTRLQQLELALLTSGQSVPVSPRDNHQIHLQMILPVLEQLAGALNEGQANTDTLEVTLIHGLDHYTQAIQQGMPPAELAAEKKTLDALQKVIVKLRELDKQAELMQSAGQALQQKSASEDALAAQSMAVASVPDVLVSQPQPQV